MQQALPRCQSAKRTLTAQHLWGNTSTDRGWSHSICAYLHGSATPPDSIAAYLQWVRKISANGTAIASGFLTGLDFLSGLSESLSQENVMIFDAFTISGMIVVGVLLIAVLASLRTRKRDE